MGNYRSEYIGPYIYASPLKKDGTKDRRVCSKCGTPYPRHTTLFCPKDGAPVINETMEAQENFTVGKAVYENDSLLDEMYAPSDGDNMMNVLIPNHHGIEGVIDLEGFYGHKELEHIDMTASKQSLRDRYSRLIEYLTGLGFELEYRYGVVVYVS